MSARAGWKMPSEPAISIHSSRRSAPVNVFKPLPQFAKWSWSLLPALIAFCSSGPRYRISV